MTGPSVEIVTTEDRLIEIIGEEHLRMDPTYFERLAADREAKESKEAAAAQLIADDEALVQDPIPEPGETPEAFADRFAAAADRDKTRAVDKQRDESYRLLGLSGSIFGIRETQEFSPAYSAGWLVAGHDGGPGGKLGGLNRSINWPRVEGYRKDMQIGRWHFSPDPIVFSTDGAVLNGQHRIAAALLGNTIDDFPSFVVIRGVDKKAALLMDEAKRSPNDRRDIALRFAESI